MVIVQINVVYGSGSTGKIVQVLHEEYLKHGHDSYVLFGRGAAHSGKRIIRSGFLFEAKLWRFIQLFTGNFLAGSPLSTWNLKRHIKKLKPDVVHLHCINGNMCNVFSLFKWLRIKGYKTVLTHHAKFMFTGGCGLNMCEKYSQGCGNCPHKQEFFGKWCSDRSSRNIRRLDKLQMTGAWIKHVYVSYWLKEQAVKSAVLFNADNHVVLNPVDSKIFNTVSIRKALHGRSYVFFPTSLRSDIKGWNWIEPVGAGLEDMGLDLLVTGLGQDRFSSPNIYDIGCISDQGLMAEYYRQAKATLILSQCESFSMPVIESLLCGTPVFGFEAGGPESICPASMRSHFVKQGDINALLSVLKSSLTEEKKIVPVRDLVGSVWKHYLSIYSQ